MKLVDTNANEVPEVEVKEIKKPVQTPKSVYAIPPGYLAIEMSTEGKLNVPAVVHVKNFTTEFLVDLALASEEVLPEKLIQSLQSLIWEKDVDVGEWPEKMAIELLVKIYANFFTPIMTSVPFPVLDSDLEYLEKNNRKEEKESILSESFVPRIDIDLRSFESISVDPKVKNCISYKKKDGTFSVKIRSYIRLKDSVLIRKAVEKAYRDKDKQYAKIKQDVDIRSAKLNAGDYTNLPVIDPYELLAWKTYEAGKALYGIQLARAVGLVYYEGKDVSESTLEEKVKILENDPRFDSKLSKLIDEQVAKLKFGINPEIEVTNPITGEVCKRTFTFRLVDILQAIQLSNTTEYDFYYDDEN